jgi:uroporphyrinogen decarboxylase
MLYAQPERIREAVKKILEKFGRGPGHIFNLGHGILPDIPVEHAKAFVRAVKEESAKYHN